MSSGFIRGIQSKWTYSSVERIHTWFIDKIIHSLVTFSVLPYRATCIAYPYQLCWACMVVGSQMYISCFHKIPHPFSYRHSLRRQRRRRRQLGTEAANWRICLLRFYCVFVEPFFPYFRPMLIKGYPPHEFHEYIFSTCNSIQIEFIQFLSWTEQTKEKSHTQTHISTASIRIVTKCETWNSTNKWLIKCNFTAVHSSDNN